MAASKSLPWVRKILDLNELPQYILDLVDQNEISLGNAILLVKAPDSAVGGLIDEAQLLPYEEFEVIVSEKIRELRTHNVGIMGGDEPEWEPPPEKRKIKDLIPLAKNLKSLDSDTYKYLESNDLTVFDAFIEGVKYSISLDSATVEKRKGERKKTLRQQKMREIERKALQKEEEAQKLKEEIKRLKESLGEE